MDHPFPAQLITRGDARALPLRSGVVDVVVTSPPYFLLKDYDAGPAQIGVEATPAGYVDALIGATAEMMRVLTPKGSIWVNLGDKYNAYNANRGDGKTQKNTHRQRVERGYGLDVKGVRNKSLIGLPWRYALRCIDDLGLVLRQEIIWEKIGGLPEHAKDRSRRNHETWFHFTKTDRYYTNPVPMETASVRRVPLQPYRTPTGFAKHPAPFPKAWVKWILEGWCPPGGVMLDPFGGAGTASLVARDLGRRAVSVDLSAAYSQLAQHRAGQ